MTSYRPVLDEAEVIVVGGGPAGSIAAFELAERGRDVVLIDKHSFPRDKACGDGLTSSAVAFLHELGLEQALEGAQPMEDVRFFVDWRERESAPLRAGTATRPYQACCVPRRQFDRALVELACAAGARPVHGYVTRPLWSDGGVVGVELTHGAERMAIRARHVLAADGATSRLRRELGGKLRRPGTFGYAIRRYVCTDRVLAPSFEIYAPLPDDVLNYGYGWLFPVGERVANVGLGYLSTQGLGHPQSINELLDSFMAGLRHHQGGRLGNLDPLGRAIGGSFGGEFAAERCQRDGIVFAGDAAQTTDPLTGEGIDQAMRSAHIVAVAIDGALRRRTRHVDVGGAIRRANLRLGQDSAMMARLAHELLGQRATRRSESPDLLVAPGPLLQAAGAMVTADVARPALMDTPAGRLASRLACLDRLVDVDERLREEVRNEFILAAELLQREVCAGLGPVAALTVLAGELACGSEPDHRSVDAALSVELLCAFPAMLSRVSAADGSYASTNNGLALMIGDYGLCRAMACAPDLGVDVSRAIGEAIEANSEGVALRARDRATAGHSVERYLGWARLTSGANLSLAAELGGRLAGADGAALDALRGAGEQLGVAMQICEDMLAMAADDPVTGRRPRHVLEEGHFSLSVLLADDLKLVDLTQGERESAEWDGIVARVSEGAGPARAIEICLRYCEQARGELAVAGLADGPLAQLCDLPERHLGPPALVRAV